MAYACICHLIFVPLRDNLYVTMKQLVIIGAGGMGRSMYDMACNSIGFGVEYSIKGFIDDDTKALDGFATYPPVLDTISGYTPQAEDVFICSIGGASRRKCIEQIRAKGGHFINLIHKTAFVGTNVQMGEGNILGSYARIACDSKIGSHNLIQNFANIAHDCRLGDFNRVDCYVMMVGGTQLQDETTIHTAAVLNHNVVVESNAHVAAMSFVIRRVKAGTTVMGNPATLLKM